MSRADEILDLTQELIQAGGYNAFSYQDLSNRLGIKKASIHYHFPRKIDLGVALMQRYRTASAAYLTELEAIDDGWGRFNGYLGPWRAHAEAEGSICLGAILGGEFGSLPSEICEEVTTWFQLHESWLTRCLEDGRTQGAFDFPGPAANLADMMVSALNGGLIVARARGDVGCFNRVVRSLKGRLGLAMG